MKGLFARQAFTGFGPHGLPAGEAVLTVVEGRRPRRLRARVRAECPRLPRVYGMVDAAGGIVHGAHGQDPAAPAPGPLPPHTPRPPPAAPPRGDPLVCLA